MLAFFAINAYGLPWGDRETSWFDFPEDSLALNTLQLPGFFPEFDFYYNWDSTVLDPYRLNVKNLNVEFSVAILAADCGYNLPIVGRVNSGFGWRHGRPHQGVDLQLRTGDSVSVAFDGVVRMSKWYAGYGNCVIVRHYNGFETLYGHLSKRIVKTGDLLNAGQVIGLGGSTGHSTGPHLHFETRFLGRPIDPANIIDFKADTLVSNTITINKNSFGKPISKYARLKYKHRSKYRRSRALKAKRIKRKIRKPARRRRH